MDPIGMTGIDRKIKNRKIIYFCLYMTAVRSLGTGASSKYEAPNPNRTLARFAESSILQSSGPLKDTSIAG